MSWPSFVHPKVTLSMLRSGWSQFPPYRVPSWHSIFALQAKPVGHHPRSFMHHSEGIVMVFLDDFNGSGVIGYINFAICVKICKRYPYIDKVILLFGFFHSFSFVHYSGEV